MIIETKQYPIHVGRDLIDRTGALVRARGKVFVVTSTGLREAFGDRVAASFEPVADVITVEEGESRKTLGTANHIVTNLLDRGAKRDSMLVAVGGGMMGDTAGFAAAIFLRGIDLVHVPTTLLAQVDSSIGGKTAVNHARGKNLIGAFHPPRAVVIDPAVLHSLPARERVSGLYEALKGGVIGDPTLFEMFEKPVGEIDELIVRAILVKVNIVDADEREADLRRLLNYGHTIAHGIENAMNYQGITHGEAVAWGMIGANAIAVRRGILPRDVSERIERAIAALAPRRVPRGIDAKAILAATEHDKKNTGSTRVMVLPSAIGTCEIVSDVAEEEIAYGIDAVLA
ncbi:MAG TPA: 3-dehydroquinate synthase [Thermoanaerobaculia bacterium]|nr:3-dehydroquinate synthase [Thermoanaerobaculia bacterium]